MSVISADIVGDVANYYYSQFELCTREQKMNQIILLQVQLYRLLQILYRYLLFFDVADFVELMI